MTSNQVTPAQEAKIAALEAEVANLQSRLGLHDPEEIVKKHIRLLHTYNEIKDGAQRLIGAYAQITQKTITAVHEDLGLSLTE